MHLIRAMRVPLVVWLVLEGMAAGGLVWSARELPPGVASHFGAQGQADGWMPRETYLEFMGGIGLLLPLSLLGTGLLIGVMPAGTINLPHRDYWLAPERHRETRGYMARHMAWFACGMTVLFTAINWLVVEGNRSAPPHLTSGIWLLLGLFLAFVVAWLVVLITHFSRVPRVPG